jgi:putative oxygen-independent coproporphyrinogen III oxidase
METPPLSIYIHFPWCVRKCPYCDFNSHPLKEDLPQEAYVAQLLADLDHELPRIVERPIRSVFFGGGTPSLFAPSAFARIIGVLRQRAELLADAEVTVEANPGALDRHSFDGYLSAGINRISIGAQSFAAHQLKALGRIHGPDDILAAIDAARAAGFRRVNLDLMHGLPGQLPADAASDLRAACEAGVDHVSWYQLTIEPKTTFARRPPALPGEDVLVQIEDDGLGLLAAAGYRRYEVSAFAKPGQEARHNVNYWTFGDYLGIGAGAHGKWTDPADGRILRTAKPAQPRLYLSTPAEALRAERALTTADLPGEFMLNALRLLDGVPHALFTRRTGLSYSHVAEPVTRLVERRLMRPDRLALTADGLRFLDSVVAEFF